MSEENKFKNINLENFTQKSKKKLLFRNKMLLKLFNILSENSF
jgi:hypothetical protein